MQQLFILWLLMMVSSVVKAECNINHSQLRAEYQLQTFKNGQVIQTSPLVLWRNGNTVAHQFPNTEITESWFLLNNKQIKPTRFFDHYQRAIEYQPGEKVHGKTEKDWDYRYQLISASLLPQLTLSAESGSGCQKEQTYSKSTENTTIVLKWLPELQLVSSFSSTRGDIKETWQLTSQQYDQPAIEHFFTELSQYQSTDYADIGDDHTDPFLAKMINLGFVEHGASGFYNTDGQPIEGGHH